MESNFKVTMEACRSISSLNTIENKLNALKSIEQIFFQTTSIKEFSSDEQKQKFFRKWTEYYLKFCLEEVYLYLDQQKDILGYLTGCNDSLKALAHFEIVNPAYCLFADLFSLYPAHLHINVAPGTQGKGIGTKLIAHFCEDLKKQNIRGLHAVSSSDAANLNFYRRQGFDYEIKRNYKNTDLIFFGMKL